LTLVYQNDLKILKNINLKKNTKKIQFFFKSAFKTQKQTGPLEAVWEPRSQKIQIFFIFC